MYLLKRATTRKESCDIYDKPNRNTILIFCYNGKWQTDHECEFGNAAKIKKEKILLDI